MGLREVRFRTVELVGVSVELYSKTARSHTNSLLAVQRLSKELVNRSNYTFSDYMLAVTLVTFRGDP